MTDTAITVSSPFSIQPTLVIGVPASVAQANTFAKFADQAQRPVNIPRGMALTLQVVMWYEVAIIPKGLDTTAIRTLTDIERVGGKRFQDEGRSIITAIALPTKKKSSK